MDSVVLRSEVLETDDQGFNPRIPLNISVNLGITKPLWASFLLCKSGQLTNNP